MPDSHPRVPGEDRHLKIRENGRIIDLDYDGLESFHKGDAWWGCTVGFRALQLAATAFSPPEFWDRNFLSVISKHPGPGVRDAFEYVTRCVSAKRYYLDDANENAGCNRDMNYEWTITSRETSILISLRGEFIPAIFFGLIERLGTEHEHDTDQKNFSQLKTDLCTCIWRESLNRAFKLNYL